MIARNLVRISGWCYKDKKTYMSFNGVNPTENRFRVIFQRISGLNQSHNASLSSNIYNGYNCIFTSVMFRVHTLDEPSAGVLGHHFCLSECCRPDSYHTGPAVYTQHGYYEFVSRTWPLLTDTSLIPSRNFPSFLRDIELRHQIVPRFFKTLEL